MSAGSVLMTADAVGGVWRYAMDLGGALAARGVQVTVAVMGPLPSDGQALEAERRGIALVAGAYRLEWMDDPWDDVARAGDWLVALERRLRPDVVHLNGYSHAPLPWSAPVLVVAHSCVCSWWRAVHGVEAPPRWDRYRSAVSRGLSAAHGVIAPTAAMLDALEREYGPCPGARVIANGIHLESTGPERKTPAILAAGRLWDEAKNIAALCAIAGELPWPVWVAGDDRGFGQRHTSLEGVTHLGCLPADQLSRRFAAAAIYALPARYEPFGLSVLEAARAGCALVLGDIASLRENWDGAAEFVAPDDHRALGAVLERLIANPGRRSALAAAASRRSREFSIDRTADAYWRVYEALAPAVCRS